MFTVTVFEILLFEGRSYYPPPNRVQGAEGLKFQKKIFGFFLNHLKHDWFISFGGFQWFYFIFFFILINFFSTRNTKNSIFGTPIIPQTLNINNLRTASAKSINLHAFRKLIKYYLQNVPVKAVFTVTVFKILLYEGRLLLSPAQRGAENERVKQKKYIYIYI